MGYRMLWQRARACASGVDGEQRRAIVLGAGDAGRRVVSTLHRRDGWTILAVLDDDRAKWGPRVAGVRVEGGIADLVLTHVLAGATHVIAAITGATPDHLARLLNLARQTGLAGVSMPPRGALQADEVLAEAG